MRDERKTKKQLVCELEAMRQRIPELEALGARRDLTEAVAAMTRLAKDNPNPVLQLAQDGTVLYANEASQPLLDLWKCQVGRRLPRKWRKRVSDVLPSGLSTDLEVEGRDRVFALTLVPVPDADYANVYGLDVTTRRQAEQALRESQERYRALFEYAPNAYYLNDLKGNFVDGNKAAEALIGHKKEDLIGKSFLKLKLLLPDQLPKAAATLAKNALQQPTGPDEFVLNRKDGTQVAVEISTFPVKIQGRTLVLGIARDISARKRDQEALRESEERYRLVSELTSDVASLRRFEPDGTTVTLWATGAVERILGYTAEEMDAMGRWSATTHPEDRAADAGRRAKLLGGEPDTAEFRIITKSGEVRWIKDHLRPLPDKSGRGVLVLGAIQDITERKLAEEALRESEERYRRILDTAHEGILATDTEVNITFVNSRAAEMFGYSVDEMVGRSLYVLMDEHQRADMERKLDKRRTGVVEQYDWMWRRKDGTEFWAIVCASPVFDREGRYAASLGMLTDITDRKRAEEQVEKLARFPSENPSPVLRVAADGALVYANQASTPLLQAWGCQLGQQVPETWRVRVARALDSAQSSETETQCDDRVFSVVLSPVVDAGYVNVYGLDITTRKQADQRVLQYAARLADANEELRTFVGTASHDLRAPLVNLKGFSDELSTTLDAVRPAISAALPHLNDDQREKVMTAIKEDVPEALAFINASVTRMDHLVNALLRLSRLGRRKLELEAVDMNALVEETVQALAFQIEQRDVKVTIAPLLQIVADRTSMEQIMGNLLNNAVIYLDPARPGEIEVTAERTSAETVLRIRDNGRGISKQDMSKVFAPFRRAGKQDVPGEGMGLPYVQALVRRHGGRIWCESELGAGTTFVFTIPTEPGEGSDRV